MDAKIIAQLKSLNPNSRKQAMLTLAKSGGTECLPYLKQVYLNDPEPVLREFAKQAALQIRARLEAEAQPQEASVATLKPQKLRGAEKRRQFRVEVERKERSNLWVVGLIGLGLGLVFLWLILGQQVLRVLDEDTVQSRIENASSLSFDTRRETSAGEGEFYVNRFEDGSGFYLQEGQGAMPAGGWILVVGVFTGEGDDAMGWLTRTASENNWMLLTPFFPLNADGVYDAQTADESLDRALRFVTSNYEINRARLTAYGYGVGSSLLARYIADYGGFAIASLGEITAFPSQPNRVTEYLVFGADNEINDVTLDFMNRLGVLNISVQGGKFSNIDSAELQRRQLEQTIALIKK